MTTILPHVQGPHQSYLLRQNLRLLRPSTSPPPVVACVKSFEFSLKRPHNICKGTPASPQVGLTNGSNFIHRFTNDIDDAPECLTSHRNLWQTHPTCIITCSMQFIRNEKWTRYHVHLAMQWKSQASSGSWPTQCHVQGKRENLQL